MYAYSLSQQDDGWCWSVYDEDGLTVADGASPERDAAQTAVETTLHRIEGRHETRAA